MPDAKELDAHYKTLTDRELLKLWADGGLTDEAQQVLGMELARRKLTPDEATREFAPEWLEKAEAGSAGVLVLEGGERITAEVVELNDDADRLSVKVISPENLHSTGRRNHRTIPLRRIVSFEPQPHLMERWPFTDPCREMPSCAASNPAPYLAPPWLSCCALRPPNRNTRGLSTPTRLVA